VPSNPAPHIILIDGQSGAGKTTLAVHMAVALGATIVHLDDVYPGWGGLVEGRDRVIADVLRPMRSGSAGSVQTWNWESNAPGDMLTVSPAPIVIVEGCGISTAESRMLADTVIWVEAPRELRRERVTERDGSGATELHDSWERDVETHIAEHNPIQTANVVVFR
jgi:anthranilate synthase component 1/para-aminobenzoate synthetase